MPLYLHHVFRTETMVPLLTLTVAELDNSHLLLAVFVETKLLVIIMALPRVKAARYFRHILLIAFPYCEAVSFMACEISWLDD